MSVNVVRRVAGWGTDLPGGALRATSIAWAATAVAGAALGLAGVVPLTVAALAWIAQALFLWFVLARAHDVVIAPSRFGRASLVTLLRSSIVALFAMLAFDPPMDARLQWALVVFAIVALVLDGVDGALARRDGETSAHGAWMDQEIDALFVLVLAALVWRSGDVGPWILAAGAWRYAFVALTLALPRMRRELPFSQRRRVVCVVQLAALVGCLSPIIEPPFAAPVAALSLAILSASFTVDILRLSAEPETPVHASQPT
ncbi:MAG: CDP-alcohol phosphatidyltransferase family protein [Planctomycetota bacterium]